MRVTCDLDRKSKLRLFWALFKGRILIGKTADEIFRTRRGWHLIYENLDISQERSLELRKRLGDDPKRIYLDTNCPKKQQQILFSQKVRREFNNEGMMTSEQIYDRERIR